MQKKKNMQEDSIVERVELRNGRNTIMSDNDGNIDEIIGKHRKLPGKTLGNHTSSLLPGRVLAASSRRLSSSNEKESPLHSDRVLPEMDAEDISESEMEALKSDNNDTVGYSFMPMSFFCRRPTKIASIISDGYSGASRAALDIAQEEPNIDIAGYVRRGCITDDFPREPGIKPLYGSLAEYSSDDIEDVIEANVEAADATVAIKLTDDIAETPETAYAIRRAESTAKPCLIMNVSDAYPQDPTYQEVISMAADAVCDWIDDMVSMGRIAGDYSGNRISYGTFVYEKMSKSEPPLAISLNICGARESEVAGAYDRAYDIIAAIVKESQIRFMEEMNSD